MVINTKAIALTKRLHGENFIYYDLLPESGGKIVALKRVSSKKSSPCPDLFEVIDATLTQAKGTGPYFIQEFTVLDSFKNIAKNYTTFEMVCKFIQIISKNLEYMDDQGEVYQLVTKVMTSFNSHEYPEATYLKALYALAKIEGLACDYWLKNLNEQEKNLAHHILSTPMQDLELQNLSNSIENLENFLKTNSHLII